MSIYDSIVANETARPLDEYIIFSKTKRIEIFNVSSMKHNLVELRSYVVGFLSVPEHRHHVCLCAYGPYNPHRLTLKLAENADILQITQFRSFVKNWQLFVVSDISEPIPVLNYSQISKKLNLTLFYRDTCLDESVPFRTCVCADNAEQLSRRLHRQNTYA